MGLVVGLMGMVSLVRGGVLQPSREYAHTPDEYGMKYEEVWFQTDDGYKLYGWFFPSPSEGKKCIIISDDGIGNMADNLELVGLFLSMGYCVLTYDYRGYGKSADFEIRPNVYVYPQFIKDLEAAIQFGRKKFGTVKFNLFGIGIGAALSIGVAAHRVEIVHVIADGPFLRLEDVRKRYPMVKGQEVIIPFGFDKRYEPYYALENPKPTLKKVLIIVGERDPLVGPADIKAWLKEVKTARKLVEIYVVPGATNEETFTRDRDAYFNRIRAFLGEE